MSQANNDAGNESEKPETSAEAKLFQEAYQKMGLLKRTDEQIAQLRQHKMTLIDELKAVQSRMNDEIGRLLDATEERMSITDASITTARKAA